MTFGSLDDMVNVPDMPDAACKGVADFTAENLDRGECRTLISICVGCPALVRCRELRDSFRASDRTAWSHFTGTWAGVAYTRGRPRIVTTRRR